MRCFEIKNCGASIAGSRNSACPVYNAGEDCWNYDWPVFWKAFPPGREKEEGKKNMAAECSVCSVRDCHIKEVDDFIGVILKA